MDDESNSCDLKLVNLCLQKHSACISENVSSEGVYVVGGSIEGFGWWDDVDLFKDFSLEDKDLSEEKELQKRNMTLGKRSEMPCLSGEENIVKMFKGFNLYKSNLGDGLKMSGSSTVLYFC